MSAYAKLLIELRESVELLRVAETAEERATVADMQQAILRALDRPARLSSQALRRHVERTLAQLSGTPPRQRARIVCERLGMSKSRYYEIQKSA
jgi:hypothetical protein